MVQSIINEDDLELIRSQDRSVIYFYVDWSSFAVQGCEVLKEVELLLSPGSPAFWLADISDLDARSSFMFNWLKRREPAGVNLSLVALGNGSVAWLRRGQIVDFVLSTSDQAARTLAERTKNVFSEGAR